MQIYIITERLFQGATTKICFAKKIINEIAVLQFTSSVVMLVHTY